MTGLEVLTTLYVGGLAVYLTTAGPRRSIATHTKLARAGVIDLAVGFAGLVLVPWKLLPLVSLLHGFGLLAAAAVARAREDATVVAPEVAPVRAPALTH